MHDIQSRSDIEKLVTRFYQKATKDDKIGFFFSDVVQLNWDEHIPVICDFWESVLLKNNLYRGNPLQVHLDLHQKSPLQTEHFDRWLTLFNETINESFAGENAELAKTRALSIATVIRSKTYMSTKTTPK